MSNKLYQSTLFTKIKIKRRLEMSRQLLLLQNNIYMVNKIQVIQY